jgi:hypothetical protein
MTETFLNGCTCVCNNATMVVETVSDKMDISGKKNQKKKIKNHIKMEIIMYRTTKKSNLPSLSKWCI